MIRQLTHCLKTEHGAPRTLFLSPTTMVVGPNGSGKTALTQALNAVVYGSIPDVRGKRVSGTESMALMGVTDDDGKLLTPMRVEAVFDDGSDSKNLFWLIESSAGRKTPKLTWIGVNDAEGEGTAVDGLLHDLMAIDGAGEDKAVRGWLELFSERMSYEAANLMPKLDRDFEGNTVMESLRLLSQADDDLKRAKDEMARVELLESAGVPVESSTQMSAKMSLTVAEQRKKVAKGRVGDVWVKVRGILSGHLRHFSTTQTWETWLRGRPVEVDGQGRLMLGGHPVMSGAETWMARLVVMACFVASSAYSLVTIEDDPFDDYAKLHWPEPLMTGECGVQVVITSAHDVVEDVGSGGGEGGDKEKLRHIRRCRQEILDVLSQRIAVVHAPLLPGMWMA